MKAATGSEANISWIWGRMRNTRLVPVNPLNALSRCFQGLWVSSSRSVVCSALHLSSESKWLSFTGRVSLSWQKGQPELSSYPFMPQLPRWKASVRFHGNWWSYVQGLLMPRTQYCWYIKANICLSSFA